MFGSEYHVLLEVVDKSTGKALLPLKEIVECAKPYEMEVVFKDRITQKYYQELINDSKYIPSIKKVLSGKDWYISCVLVKL